MNRFKGARTVFGFSLCSALMVLLCSAVLAAEYKPAQMSFQAVVRNSAKVKAWVEEIKRMQTETIAKVNTLTSELGKLEQQLAKAADKAEEKEKLDAEIKKKREELRSEQESAKVKVSFRQQSMQNVIKSQVYDMVEKIAKEDGYTMVISSEAIYYSKDIPDITDRVTRAVDALPSLPQQEK
jgi:outer membrane protein